MIGGEAMEPKFYYLKKYFGHDTYREGQEQIVDCLLSGRDALGIMPTGAGKSICYQIPALIFDGVTIVISPLVSLMKDQVTSLVQAGIPAAYLNSTLTMSQYATALKRARNGTYKIIYVAPERLLTPGFLSVCSQLKISMVAVDEAHCVSQWGQDFRPSYLKISEFVDTFKSRPIVGAFTATATSDVKEDIISILKLNDPFTLVTGFDRENLFFSVEKPEDKKERLLELLNAHKDKSGIIYCSTRKTVDEICDYLNAKGYSAARYHAGLEKEDRYKNQDDFVYDRVAIMVATNAFGMGIDKSNISYVIHYNMPKNIESYYQEAGRAGRDGERAECYLLYSPSDVRTNRFLIDKSMRSPEMSEDQFDNARILDYKRLKNMTLYCATSECLRNYMLKYFGDKGKIYCGNCSNCLTKFEVIDITDSAQTILKCVRQTEQRFGKSLVCEVLKGSKNQRVLNLGFDTLSTYGALKKARVQEINDIIDYLEENEYIKVIGRQYPIIRLTAKADEVFADGFSLTMKAAKSRIRTAKPTTEYDEELFSVLKSLHSQIAATENAPAYIVFSNLALIDMCRKLPKNEEEFLAVEGVGKVKQERYGKLFVDKINKYLAEKDKKHGF